MEDEQVRLKDLAVKKNIIKLNILINLLIEIKTDLNQNLIIRSKL